MNTDSLKNSIDTLRSAVEANTVTPDIVANILDTIRNLMQEESDKQDENVVFLKSNLSDFVNKLNDFLTSVDATDTAINKWKELENFLAGITDTDTLTGLLYEQETRLNDTIGEETARATKAENDLQASVTANTRSIETEVSRAKAVEQQLKDGKADKVTDAANGNLAAFDSSGNLSDSSITAAKVETFISTMPTATAENEGKIYLYTGTSDSSGTFYPGNKYVCRSYDDGFRWESLNGYVIAPEGISGGGGTSLPDGTIVVPLKTTTIGSVTYYAGTPLIVQNGGWYPWRGDTAKVAVIWDLPVASSENEGMTYLSLNFNDTPNPRGFYTSYKSSDGQYSWRKVGLLSEENFTTAEKEKLASIGSGEGGVGDLSYLETQLNSEIERAKGAENDLQISLVTEISRATAAEQANAEAIETEASRAEAAEQANAEAISTETSRATAAEQANAEAIETEASRAEAAEEVLRSSINAVSSSIPSISDMDISEIDSLGNTTISGTYIVKDGAKRGILLFENTGNNAQRQTLYIDNILKRRNRDAAGWSEWKVLADLSDGLAAVATSGSYNDLKNRPSLSAVATSGSYESLSDKPIQGSISLDAADSLCQSYQNGVYMVTDGGMTQGLLFFSTAGTGGLMQYLLQDGTIKSRSGTYTGTSPTWNEWQSVDFGVSDYNDLLNQPVQIIENENYLDNLTYSNTSGIYVIKSGYGATLYISATTSSSTYIQIRIGYTGIAYRNGYSTEALGNKEWTTFVHYPYDWDSISVYNNIEYPSDLNNFTEEGIYFVKGTNNKATNLPITNTGDTINVSFTLLVSVSKPITLENGTERAIIGQNLTLANRIGSENKQYLRHAISDTKDGATTCTWGAWKEVVTQTLLGGGSTCTDAEIDAAIDNGIYSGVTSQSGILPAYSTFTMVVVNNYAATAAASAMGVPSDWRQVTQTFIAVPLSTDGQINGGATYMRTGIGGNTISWGELKQVGGEDIMLYTPEANAEVTWDLKKYQNFGCPFDMDVAKTVTINIKLDESIPYPYYKKYNLFVNYVSQSSEFICHIQTEKEFDFKYLCKARISNIPFFENIEKTVTMQDANISLYDTPCMAILHVYFTGTKYYIYMDY